MNADDQAILRGLTDSVLKTLEKQLIYGKAPMFYKPILPTKWYRIWYWRSLWYLNNLSGAWLAAIKALAGIDPHEHCDEDW